MSRSEQRDGGRGYGEHVQRSLLPGKVRLLFLKLLKRNERNNVNFLRNVKLVYTAFKIKKVTVAFSVLKKNYVQKENGTTEVGMCCKLFNQIILRS